MHDKVVIALILLVVVEQHIQHTKNAIPTYKHATIVYNYYRPCHPIHRVVHSHPINKTHQTNTIDDLACYQITSSINQDRYQTDLGYVILQHVGG